MHFLSRSTFVLANQTVAFSHPSSIKPVRLLSFLTDPGFVIVAPKPGLWQLVTASIVCSIVKEMQLLYRPL